MTVLDAYRGAFATQLRPAMLVLAVGPVLAAAIFWGVVIWWKWAAFLAMVDSLLRTLPGLSTVTDRLVVYGIHVVPGVLTLWVLAALYVPLTLLCALGFVSLFGMPLMIGHVAGRDFAGLARSRGGSFTGSLGNSLGALARFLFVAILSFPFWFIPFIGWMILPFLLGRLNARVLSYDALSDHADAAELAALRDDSRLSWGWLGFVGAVLNLVPFFWFFSTTLTGLAFIHYGLDALARQRAGASRTLRS